MLAHLAMLRSVVPLDGSREELTGSVLKATDIVVPLVALGVAPGSENLLVASHGVRGVEGASLGEQTAVGGQGAGVELLALQRKSVVRRHGHDVAHLRREINGSAG